MSVSGHKSVASMQSYASRVDDSEKLLMAEKLNNACVFSITDGNVKSPKKSKKSNKYLIILMC